MITVPISELLKESKYQLSLTLMAGRKGLSNKIAIPHIQKPGLALTGHTLNLHPGRIQILGTQEITYLQKQDSKRRTDIIRKICREDIACFVVTHGNKVPDVLIAEADKTKTPVLATPLKTSIFIQRVTRFLDESLSAQDTIHGVLIDVYGIGVLLLGKSGIGKSECALELVVKGHRLVADDAVTITKKLPNTVFGSGSDLVKYHMEIRGLGIINIKDLYGVSSVRDHKMIELAIELIEWNPKQEIERLGIKEQTYDILDVQVPYLKIPIRPGRSLSTIIEVAARNQLLKLKGIYSAQELQENLNRDLLLREHKEKRLKQLFE